MTLNDAVKRIKDRSHRGDVNITTDETTAQIIRAIDDAKGDILQELPKTILWKASTVSLVQGTTVYSLASDLQEPIVFSYITNNQLRVLRKVESEREWINNIKNPATPQNFPTHYREIGPDSSRNKQIEIFPAPDAAYTLDYEYYRDGTLTALTTADLDSELPDLPSYAQDPVWKGGLYYFLKGFDDPAQVIAKQDYDKAREQVNEMEEQDLDADNCFRFETNNRYGPEQTTQTGIRLV